jgi:RHS repeat-associated protein
VKISRTLFSVFSLLGSIGVNRHVPSSDGIGTEHTLRKNRYGLALISLLILLSSSQFLFAETTYAPTQNYYILRSDFDNNIPHIGATMADACAAGPHVNGSQFSNGYQSWPRSDYAPVFYTDYSVCEYRYQGDRRSVGYFEVTAKCAPPFVKNPASTNPANACMYTPPVTPDKIPGPINAPDNMCRPGDDSIPLLIPIQLPSPPVISPAGGDGDNKSSPAGSSGSGGDGTGGGNIGGSGHSVGEPINTANGNKYDVISDYVAAGHSPLRFLRYYDSQMPVSAAMGSHWRHFYERAIETVSSTVVKTRRADGKAYQFTLNNGAWTSGPDVNIQLQPFTDGSGQSQGWKLTTAQDDVEVYNAQGQLTHITSRGGMGQSLAYNSSGQLISVTDSQHHVLKLDYDGQGRVVVLTDSAGNPYRYTYDAVGNLSTRTTPDNRVTSYSYEKTDFPNALTRITDANGVITDITGYDSQGRAIYNEGGAGANSTTIAYGADGNSSTVTDAYGTVHNFTFQLIQGVMQSSGLTLTCPTCSTNARSTTHDDQGNITAVTDFNGIKTTYGYDLTRNLEITRTEAVGTSAERTITTVWHPAFHVPSKITEPGRVTDMSYDSNGNMVSLAVTDTASNTTRTWNYTYDQYGSVLTSTQPNGSTITYADDASGNVITATDSVGLVTHFDNYDANGLVGTITYPNGRSVVFTYDTIGRVLTRTEAVQSPDVSSGPSSFWQTVLNWLASLLGGGSPTPVVHATNGAATTTYSYNNTGLLAQITLPDGDSLQYQYDAAYRLISLKDTLGNTATITRDALGKPTHTQITDSTGALVQALHRTYDALGRVAQWQGNNGQSLTNNYDAEGYLLSQVDAQSRTSTQTHDGLYRTTTQTDAGNAATQMSFNPLDQLTSVTDALGHTTQYNSNAFGEVVQEQSPDRGSTNRVYRNGLLMSSTDARGVTHQYTYDADGRRVSSTSPHSTFTYSYDAGDFGKGKLTGFADNSGHTDYRYTSQGRVAEKTTSLQNGPTLDVRYSYTLGGKLQEIATPSNHLIQYSYDTQGRPRGVAVDGKAFLNNLQFGATGITGWTWANGTARNETHDLDGRLTQIRSGNALNRSYTYDTVNRVTGVVDTLANVNDRYSYDAQNHLTTQQSSNTSTNSLNRYAYDALGNRQQDQQQKGSTLQSTGYLLSTLNNQVMSATTNNSLNNQTKNYTYLPSGQTSSDGSHSFIYDDEGRLSQVSGYGYVHNDYNALGQRVRKIGQGVTVFTYDEAGHLMGEYTPGGEVIREYIWLGNRLVGLISQQEKKAGVLYVHTDHLGTPRAISDQGTTLWRWEGEAFGNSQPNEQVAGPSRKLSMPLRFPGQYYDSETGLSYNYFRDYNPQTGRYIESDPIGLMGGVNTYVYVGGNPINGLDPEGLVNLSNLALAGSDFALSTSEAGAGVVTMIASAAGLDSPLAPFVPATFGAGSLMAASGELGMANANIEIQNALNDTSNPGVLESLGDALFGKIGDFAGSILDKASTIPSAVAGAAGDIKDIPGAVSLIKSFGDGSDPCKK